MWHRRCSPLREVSGMQNGGNKLFHVLVVVGASMTGSACGGAVSDGQVDAEAAHDAALDAVRDAKSADGPYGNIVAPCTVEDHCPDAMADAYAHIAPNPQDSGHGLDASEEDAYVGISPGIIDGGMGNDAYPNIK